MIIGRKKEIARLNDTLKSAKSEFVVIYGRRRVGKTFLVKEVFGTQLDFACTGIYQASTTEQLFNFQDRLQKYAKCNFPKFKNWLEAFSALEKYLEEKPKSGKKIVFLDELPWFEGPKSRFMAAFEHFWNGFAAMRNDILLIVCGSATSWIINKVINSHGGLHDRVNHQIYLRPFVLKECEEMADAMNLEMTRRDILNGYMTFGGIPYYWSLLQSDQTLWQNVDRLCFSQGGDLTSEFKRLYSSLYTNPEPYLTIITTLATKKCGMTRDEIAEKTKLNDGGKLTKYLAELEQCDFIRRYTEIGKVKKGSVYQLIDPFTLFYFRFIHNHPLSEERRWTEMMGSPTYNNWVGHAFERVCLMHIPQIKQALGISGIASTVHSWRYQPSDPKENGVEIDLLIDRFDAYTICEMKYSPGEFEIKKSDYQNINNKIDVFSRYFADNKAVRLAMITLYGVKPNKYSSMVLNQVTLPDLFT